MSIAGLLLCVYAWMKKLFVRIPTLSDVWYFFLIMIVHIYAAFVLDLVALQDMTSSKGAFIYNMSPFLTAILSYHYFTEKMTYKKIVGLCIGFAGFLPELLRTMPNELPNNTWLLLSRSEWYMIGSVIASVYGWIIVRLLIRRGYHPIMINGIGMIGGGILAFITSYSLGEGDRLLVSNWPYCLLLTMLIIIVSNIGLYNLYGYLLRIYTATFLSFAGFLCPLMAALFGWFFLCEPINISFLFSLSMVTVGLIIFYYEELRQGYIIQQSQ